MSLAVLDWRRRVAELYREVRAEPDPAVSHEHWTTVRDELLVGHLASPIPIDGRAKFAGAVYGAYDSKLRFEVDVEDSVEALTFRTETGTDGTVVFTRIGVVELLGVGSLDVWWHEGYGGGVFVPFADPSPRTYGGGRYLIDTTKGADLGGDIDPVTGHGTLVIDLNFAYNPSCAYDPAWACPLAPLGNRLDVPIEAGEHHQAD